MSNKIGYFILRIKDTRLRELDGRGHVYASFNSFGRRALAV